MSGANLKWSTFKLLWHINNRLIYKNSFIFRATVALSSRLVGRRMFFKMVHDTKGLSFFHFGYGQMVCSRAGNNDVTTIDQRRRSWSSIKAMLARSVSKLPEMHCCVNSGPPQAHQSIRSKRLCGPVDSHHGQCLNMETLYPSKHKTFV